MFKALLARLWPIAVIAAQPENQSCGNCACFEDDYEPEHDDADDHSGYCCNAMTCPEYGGHWTYQKSWCSLWIAKPQTADAVDPIGVSNTGTPTTRESSSSSVF